MNTKDKISQEITFTINEPPFDVDPSDLDAMKKLAHANKIGSGTIIEKISDQESQKMSITSQGI